MGDAFTNPYLGMLQQQQGIAGQLINQQQAALNNVFINGYPFQQQSLQPSLQEEIKAYRKSCYAHNTVVGIDMSTPERMSVVNRMGLPHSKLEKSGKQWLDSRVDEIVKLGKL